jgi:quercetin dioxygenase-like cupin family protein
MTWTPRRVVTGHDEAGKSVFVSDGAPPVIRTAAEGAVFVELWSTDASPAPVAPTEPEPTERDLTVPPGPSGTKIRINEIPPGAASPMHRTETIDYGVVLEGEIVLVLDDSETTLRAGDVVIQRGTDHRWENRSSEPTRVAFILIDGTFTDDLRALLPDAELMEAPPGH